MVKRFSSSRICDALVVGAGPAGMMAAISAALRGASVVLIEQLTRPGMKLLATGGGRCNVTNTLEEEEFMSRFGKQGRFLQPALSMLNSTKLRAFLAKHGAPTMTPDGFHVYPASHSSTTIQQALWRFCAELNIERRLGVEAKELVIRENTVAGLQTSAGAMVAQNVVLATGGKSYSKLGATGSGYVLAARSGHPITALLPVLVPLVTRETWPPALSGVSLRQVRVWIDLPLRQTCDRVGDMLFTRTGISGPAILDLSRDVVPLLQKHGDVPIRLDIQPQTTVEQWRGRFDEWQSAHGRKKIVNLLDRHLPASLAKMILRLARLAEETSAASFSRPQREAVLGLVNRLPLIIQSAGGFDCAMATRGGVDLRAVDSKTLQSKKIRGLYFAGELLDLDGPCGGYNLQWAFSSGWLAGAGAAQAVARAAAPREGEEALEIRGQPIRFNACLED